MIQKFSVLKIEAFLKTAGIEEAYTKYYSNIPREIFNRIVAADPSLQIEEDETPNKIGTYGQWLLRMYTQGKLKLEDLEKTYDNLEKLMLLVPQLKRKKESVDINKFKNPTELFTFISERKQYLPPDKEDLSNNPEQLLENTYFIDNGEAKKVFENKDVVIIVPETLEASQFYAEGTNWCTRYPNMFRQYTEDYPPDNTLWIMIHKRDPYNLRFQLHFPTQQFMNLRDNPIDITSLFRQNKEVEAFLKNHYFPEGSIEQIFAKHGNENGLGIMVDKMSDLTNIRRYNNRPPFIDTIWEDGLFGVYENDLPFKDIINMFDVSTENLKTVSTYLQKTYAGEIAEYERENDTEIDWYNMKDIYSFIKFVDEDDIPRIFSIAFEDAGREKMESEVIDALKELFSDHFGVDFSKWYPGGFAYITKEALNKQWYKFAGKDFSEIDSIDFLLGSEENDERNYVPERDIQSAIERAESNSYVEDHNFNEQLKYRLSEELPA